MPAQRLEVATASHSPVLDPRPDDIEAAAAAVTWRPARLPIASDLTGGFVQHFDARYCRRQACRAVGFAARVRTGMVKGCHHQLQVGTTQVFTTPVPATSGRD